MATGASTTSTTTSRKDPRATARAALGGEPGKGAGAARQEEPPATLILFVRHGTTPTTGKVLPGRAPGLHLADRGRAEAEGVAERLAALTTATATPPTGAAPTTATSTPPAAATPRTATSTPTARAAHTAASPNGAAASGQKAPEVRAIYASPLERAQETAAPIATRLGLAVVTEEGLIEMDFGEWTGAELKALRKLPEWNAVQRYPSGFQFPGGEAFAAMRARIAATVATLCRKHPGETIVCVSHADPIKAAVSDALGTHLDLFQRISISTCSVTAISYSSTGPAVLAVNTTGGIGDLRPR